MITIDGKEYRNLEDQVEYLTDNLGETVTHVNNLDSYAGKVDTLYTYVPLDVSTDNKLATVNFVNSSIASNTATFVGTFNSVDELPTTGITPNDYAFVVGKDASGNTVYERYKWTGSQWLYEYTLNNSSFTAQQWDAINSGITSELVNYIGAMDGTAVISSQYIRIWDLPVGIYKLTYNGPKYIYYKGATSTQVLMLQGTNVDRMLYVTALKNEKSFRIDGPMNTDIQNDYDVVFYGYTYQTTGSYYASYAYSPIRLVNNLKRAEKIYTPTVVGTRNDVLVSKGSGEPQWRKNYLEISAQLGSQIGTIMFEITEDDIGNEYISYNEIQSIDVIYCTTSEDYSTVKRIIHIPLYGIQLDRILTIYDNNGSTPIMYVTPESKKVTFLVQTSVAMSIDEQSIRVYARLH